MTTERAASSRLRDLWNKGRLIGQKRPLKPKDVWTRRTPHFRQGRAEVDPILGAPLSQSRFFSVVVENRTSVRGCPAASAKFVETDMWTSVAREQGALLKQSPEEFTRQRLRQIPLGRMERPEDVTNVIGFLVSPRSEYMTGQALSVDGGLVMHG